MATNVDRLPPPGIRLVADPGLRRVGAGRVLIGGSPLRITRLSAAGAAVVDAWLEGTPLADVKSARGLARRLLDAGMLHPVVAPAPSPPPVTVVVPSFEDADQLDALLATLTVPVVVVDDASSDAAAIAAVAERHGATLVRRTANGGPGAARMSGLEEVDTTLVAFVDTDVTLPDDWWSRLAPHFDDPAVVAVAPRVRSRDGTTLRERYERAQSPLDIGPTPAAVGPRRRLAYVPTAVFAARVDAVIDVGGFDPGLRVGEDVDLVWRLVARGGTVRYDPGVEVEHRPRPSWLAMARQRMHYGSSAVGLTKRHGAVVAPARCSKWSLMAWLAAVSGRPGLGLGVAAGSSAALVRKFDGVPDAPREATRIAAWGHLHSGLGLGRAVSRVWWPVLLPVAALSRRRRIGVLTAMLAPAVADWIAGERAVDPVRGVALRVADDMAYGVGVWRAGLQAHDLRALVPELTEWPGRRPAIESDTVAGP
ncbi:MAG: mycofactocin biosynthesis glycosyltransferase MftF [Acidimicrobiales bacterium]|nr:mycofactocin biosynthesis glycosyltransferase MftF [Acidimicrobiales bacterium]